MDIQVIKGKYYETFVVCPRTDKKVSTEVCAKCQFLRIVLSNKVKCGWTIIKEGISNGDIIMDTLGGERAGASKSNSSVRDQS